MPLIKRIEVSNFLNSERIEPWRPDWPHQIFDLGCFNTAMNIPNGKGKSTMVLSILAMLTGHMKSLNDIRMRHYAPRRTGFYTHIRMEVLVKIIGEGGLNDIMALSEGGFIGSPMVFGLYGNSGENQSIQFYSYRGTFENCPVAHVHESRHTPIHDNVFLDQLVSCSGVFPSNAKEKTLRAWKEFVEDFFDIASIRQQLVYQLARGAEGDSTYFEVQEKKTHRTYAASIFYERLAPELLSEVMGDLGADGERGIEDTIHENVSGLIVAKRNTALKSEELRRTGNTLAQLEKSNELVLKLKEAKAEYENHRDSLALEIAALKHILVEDPLPGVPRTPGETDPKLAGSMVMQDGSWFLPDRVMAEFTGESPSNANLRADRNEIKGSQVNRSQVIEFVCNLKNRDTRGKPNQLYSRETALALLNLTTNFIQDWTREKAIAAVTEAFDWVDANGDTNPGRTSERRLVRELESAESEKKRLHDAQDRIVEEQTSLYKEQQTIGTQQDEYRRMVESDLFTMDELASPAETGKLVFQMFKETEEALNTHKIKRKTLMPVYEKWQKFRQEYGEAETPSVVAEHLERLSCDTENAKNTVKRELDEARSHRKSLGAIFDVAKKETGEAEARYNRFKELTRTVETYVSIFGEESPIGLEESVKIAYKKASERKHAIGLERSRMIDGLASLAKFRKEHGQVDPKDWLDQRLRKWEELGTQIVKIENSLQNAKQRRNDLDKASIAPGQISRDILKQAGGNPVPLYEVIGGLNLDAERNSKVLTLFSALLYAPVYSSVNEAEEAALSLVKCEIESPVFLRSELEDFCRNKTISTKQHVAYTIFLGVRTRPVDCLMDPSLVDREKATEDDRIRNIESELGKLKNDRKAFDPEHEETKIARESVTAIEQRYEIRDAALVTEMGEIEERLPVLERRSSEEAVSAIRGRIERDRLFGNETAESLSAKLEESKAKLDASQSQVAENGKKIEELENLERTKTEAYIAASFKAGNEVPFLRSIQFFIDHPEDNPAFMQSAPERQKTLESEKEKAEKRTRFRFEQADEFVRKGEARPREIEARIKEIEGEIVSIKKRIPELEKKIEDAWSNRDILEKDIEQIDDWIRLLMKKYREFLSEQKEPINVPVGKIKQHPIVMASSGVREEQNLSRQVRMILDLANNSELDEASELGRKMEKSLHALQSAEGNLRSLVDRILVMPDLDLPEHVKIELLQSRDNPDVLTHAYQVTKMNYEKNSIANATAQAYLDRTWMEVGDWLQKFTARLPDNLATMKRVFGPVRDKSTGDVIRAGFEIKATVAEWKDVRAVLDEIVVMVEQHENTKQKVLEATDNALGDLVSKLRRQIRDRFYQKVIKDPSIHVCMPAISEKTLLLERNMVSTGQGIAMTLLWIVKMADYVTEREMNRQTSDRAQLGRLRTKKTQFALIDGAFSSLSKKELVRDALASVTETDGRFQLIITGHDENYRNNFEYFPTLIEAREINGKYMYADCKTKRILQPDEIGSHYGAMELMSLRVRPMDGNGKLA